MVMFPIIMPGIGPAFPLSYSIILPSITPFDLADITGGQHGRCSAELHSVIGGGKIQPLFRPCTGHIKEPPFFFKRSAAHAHNGSLGGKDPLLQCRKEYNRPLKSFGS